MAAKKQRLILDTNLWISFLITKDYSKLDSLLKHSEAIILFSSELLEEFIEVTKRPKLKKLFCKMMLKVKDFLDLWAWWIK